MNGRSCVKTDQSLEELFNWVKIWFTLSFITITQLVARGNALDKIPKLRNSARGTLKILKSHGMFELLLGYGPRCHDIIVALHNDATLKVNMETEGKSVQSLDWNGAKHDLRRDH